MVKWLKAMSGYHTMNRVLKLYKFAYSACIFSTKIDGNDCKKFRPIGGAWPHGKFKFNKINSFLF